VIPAETPARIDAATIAEPDTTNDGLQPGELFPDEHHPFLPIFMGHVAETHRQNETASPRPGLVNRFDGPLAAIRRDRWPVLKAQANPELVEILYAVPRGEGVDLGYHKTDDGLGANVGRRLPAFAEQSIAELGRRAFDPVSGGAGRSEKFWC